MDVQAVVLRGMLQKEAWFSLRTSVTDEALTNPDARKVLATISRLHGIVDGDLSTASVRLDIQSTLQLNESLRASMLAIVDSMDDAQGLNKGELEPVVRRFVARERLMAGAMYLSAHMDDAEFDYDKTVKLFEQARDAEVGFSAAVDSYKMAGAPDVIKRSGVVPTNLSDRLDRVIGGGHGIGELMVYLGPGGTGKTSAMVKTGSGVQKMGMNVLIIGLEIAAYKYFGLLDKEITGLTKEELITSPFIAIRKRAEIPGEVWVKDWSAGIDGRKVRVADIRNLLVSMRRQGKAVHYLIVDYWELLAAGSYHKEERFNYKEIGESLRMLGNEFQIPVLTGWQTNRSGYKAHLIEEEHIGEDISVKKTADIIVTLNQNKEERRTKRMRLGLLKQRDGSDYPVVDCYWDIDRMIMRDRTDADIEDNLSVKGSKDEDGQADDHKGAEAPVEVPGGAD